MLPKLIAMNVPKLTLIGLFLTLITIGCKRSEIIRPDAAPEQFTATLNGQVFDAYGTPLSKATVKLGSRQVTTDDSGYFRVDNAMLNRNNTIVFAEKQGFFKAIKTFNASQGENRIELMLLYKNLLGSFESTTGGTVGLSNGSKIEIPADGVHKATGGTYTGTVRVFAEYIDPASNNLKGLMPGSMLGNDKSGNKIIVSPFGVLSVVLESADGELLKMAKGKKATLTTLISQSLQASAPATVSMGYLDEETGLWQEEGTATKQGNTYEGAVSHFSYWVMYYSYPAIDFSVRYVNPTGGPMINYGVEAYYTNGNTAGWGYTGSNGELEGQLPANVPFTLVLKAPYYPCYTPIHSINLPASATNISLGTVVVVNPPTEKTLKGRLRDCNGNPVRSGCVLVWFNNIWYPTSTFVNQAGEFSLLMIPCAGVLSECKILAIDSLGNKQTALINVSLNQPVTDVGDINVCDQAAGQFINYQIGGSGWWNWNSIYSYTPEPHLSIIGKNSSTAAALNCSNGQFGFWFGFTHNNAPGTISITYLYEEEMWGSYEIVTPFYGTLTKFPLQAGEFYEGSFQGYFRNGSYGTQPVFIECNFRVRKINL